jgi:hypothetical protein
MAAAYRKPKRKRRREESENIRQWLAKSSSIEESGGNGAENK